MDGGLAKLLIKAKRFKKTNNFRTLINVSLGTNLSLPKNENLPLNIGLKNQIKQRQAEHWFRANIFYRYVGWENEEIATFAEDKDLSNDQVYASVLSFADKVILNEVFPVQYYGVIFTILLFEAADKDLEKQITSTLNTKIETIINDLKATNRHQSFLQNQKEVLEYKECLIF